MQRTLRLLQNNASAILFTRQNCSLCDTAKATIQEIRGRRTFDYKEIDVMATGQDQWRELFEFDVPVTLFYANPAGSGSVDVTTQSECGKLMHRFSAQQIEALLDKAEGKNKPA